MMEKIVGLDVIAKRKNNKSRSKTAFMMMHGYGADCSDFAPIADVIGNNLDLDWYFPNGPIPVKLSPFQTGRAWFPIDLLELEKVMVEGRFREFKNLRPHGVDDAKEQILPLYDYLTNDYEKVIIGGFSQGAMMSCEISLSHDVKPSALVVLSGVLLDINNWSKWIYSCKNLPFFQSHGENDIILPYQGACELYELFQEHRLQGDLLSFRGGHEVPHQVIMGLKVFLQSHSE